MILEITKLPKETEEENIYEKLVEDFNKTAKELNLKYWLSTRHSYPKLSESFFWAFAGNYLTDYIFYNRNEDYFYFYNGIDEETFNNIKQILEKIQQKFKIDLK